MAQSRQYRQPDWRGYSHDSRQGSPRVSLPPHRGGLSPEENPVSPSSFSPKRLPNHLAHVSKSDGEPLRSESHASTVDVTTVLPTPYAPTSGLTVAFTPSPFTTRMSDIIPRSEWILVTVHGMRSDLGNVPAWLEGHIGGEGVRYHGGTAQNPLQGTMRVLFKLMKDAEEFSSRFSALHPTSKIGEPVGFPEDTAPYDFYYDRYYIAELYHCHLPLPLRTALIQHAPLDSAAPRHLDQDKEGKAVWKAEHPKERVLEDIWFDYGKYPPSPPPNGRQHPPLGHDSRKRQMQTVELLPATVEEYLNILPHGPLTIDELRLALMMRSHPHASRRVRHSSFSVPMWPNPGPYLPFVRRLANWAKHFAGRPATSTVRRGEIFAFTSTRKWQLTLEIDRDAPFWEK